MAGENEFSDNSDNGNFLSGRRQGPEHPREATAWETRKLLVTSKLPSAELLNSCQEEVRSLASEAGSQEDMIRLQAAIRSAAVRNPTLYHWCFYRMMTLIDLSFEKDEGVLPRERLPRFFTRMKGLWALARALDSIYSTRLYFSYLKIRYIQISKEYLGRPIDTVTTPLGEPHNSGENESKSRKKPAGNFNSDDDLNF